MFQIPSFSHRQHLRLPEPVRAVCTSASVSSSGCQTKYQADDDQSNQSEALVSSCRPLGSLLRRWQPC